MVNVINFFDRFGEPQNNYIKIKLLEKQNFSLNDLLELYIEEMAISCDYAYSTQDEKNEFKTNVSEYLTTCSCFSVACEYLNLLTDEYDIYYASNRAGIYNNVNYLRNIITELQNESQS